MREINDQYPEYARPYEPVKGGKHHKGLYGTRGQDNRRPPRLFLFFALIGLLLAFTAGMRPDLGARTPERPAPPSETVAVREPDKPKEPVPPEVPEDVEIVPAPPAPEPEPEPAPEPEPEEPADETVEEPAPPAPEEPASTPETPAKPKKPNKPSDYGI